MAYSFKITARRTSITAGERTALGIVGGPEDTIVDVEVLERDNAGVAVLATFQHAYIRGSTNKRQLVAACRTKAQSEGDQAKFTGGEASLVGVELPV
jgi:hypothetical protein